MNGKIRVSRQFAANFDKVAAYYECTDEEIAEMKRAVRSDLQNAEISFALMADEIRSGVTA